MVVFLSGLQVVLPVSLVKSKSSLFVLPINMKRDQESELYMCIYKYMCAYAGLILVDSKPWLKIPQFYYIHTYVYVTLLLYIFI